MSSYRAAIRGIPHTRAGLAAIDALRVAGVHTRMRARGPRAGGGGPRRPWDQDLPRERATHFTAYQEQPGQPGSGYQYADYVGTEPNGKIRLRCQS